MKTIFTLLPVTVLGVASALAQTVSFNNSVIGILKAPIYGVEPNNPFAASSGNTSAGVPPGSQIYGGSLLAGTGFTVQLWGLVGEGQPVSALQFIATTTFRTGSGAGSINTAGLPFGSQAVVIPGGNGNYNLSMSGTLQVRAWHNQGGAVTNWNQVEAMPAVARGASAVFTAGPLGGTGTPPNPPPFVLALRSFNLHPVVGLPVLAVGDVFVAEGSNGTVNAVFPVTLMPPSDQVVTVSFGTADGSALAGLDYVAASGTLVFLPGETNKSVRVVLTADADPEPDETFFANLSNAVNATILRATGTATITELRFDSIAVDIALNFHTVSGHVYVLERSDMSMGGWTLVSGATNIVGTGGSITAYDRGAGCLSGQVYRLRILQ